MTTKQRLGDIVKLSSGGTPSKKNADYWDGDIPWISAKNMKDEFLSESSLYITREGLNHGSKIAPEGSLLLLVRGSGLFKDVPICYVERDLAFNQDVKCIESIDPEKVPNKYIFYWLKSKKYALSQSVGVTTIGAGKFDTDFILNMEIPIPSREVMEKQISFFDAITKKIRYNTKINENLLQQALCLFEDEFVTKADIDEELPLYNFADYINGAAFKPDELGDAGLPVIKIAELKAGITGSTRFFSGDKGPKYLVHNKDILFSWSGNPETSIDLFIWSEGNGILNQHTFNVKSKYECPWFTFLMLKYHKPTFTHIASNKQTTGLGHVTAADLKRLTFPFDLDRMNAFETTVRPIMDLLYGNLLENRELSSLRDTLLPRLMSGELDVSDIDL